MSLIELFENGMRVSRNDGDASELSISQNNNSIALNSFKEDCKSLSGDSSFTNIIKNQFIKEITNKNIINDSINSDEEFFENENNNIFLQNSKISHFKNLENMNSYSDGEKDAGDSQVYKDIFNPMNDNNKISSSFSSNDKENINIKNINDIPLDGKVNNNSRYKKKIFKVIKARPKESKEPKVKVEDFTIKKRKPRGKKGRNNDVDWDNIPVLGKAFSFSSKKKRIIFQRKYLKMIYSIVDLPFPFDFEELFNLIKEHVGDKTAEKYGIGKSFHIIRLNGQLIVVTMKEKKMLLKGAKKEKSN